MILQLINSQIICSLLNALNIKEVELKTVLSCITHSFEVDHLCNCFALNRFCHLTTNNVLN